MKILFLMISYPDSRNNSSMYTDLAMEFAFRRYKTYVAVANGPKKSILNIESGVNVLRIRTLKLFNTSLIRKGLANILLPYQVLQGINHYFKNIHFDAIVLSTPPITYLNTVKTLKKKTNVKVYLILRDIYPQNAKDLGIIKNPLIYKYFRNKEKKLYEISDSIGCMSKGNINYILRHNPEIDPDKLHLLPNWKNVLATKNFNTEIRKKYSLENKLIVLYGGNIGRPQQVDFILELAKTVRNLSDVAFLIIGDGTEKKKMVNDTKRMRLTNVLFINNIARDKYQEIANVCDIGLVNISSCFTIPNMPSRTLSYWEAKIPILAAIDSYTDYGSILDESGSGLWCLTGDIETYKKNFMKLYSDKNLRKSMGERGYMYLLENCLTSKAYSTIVSRLDPEYIN